MPSGIYKRTEILKGYVIGVEELIKNKKKGG
mgnify:CR=1 FL=1